MTSHTFNRRKALRTLSLPLAAAVAASLAACSPQDAKPEPGSIPVASAYDTLAKEGKGFAVGALMSNNTVYVMFDPQCPHCSQLWIQSLPLHKKAKFVWMPVSIINATSTPQGAALLTAANPLEAMTVHEKSILAGSGGTSASSSIPSDVEASIKKNTNLLNALGVASVPYIVGKNASTGAQVTNTGTLSTDALAQLLGLN
jgi:thiol:disulfide interchange protein DsbG